MNQIFAAGAALSLTLLLWGLGKKPRIRVLNNLNTQNDESKFNQNGPSLVQYEGQNKSIFASSDPTQSSFSPPQTIQEEIKLKKRLRGLMSLGPKERLQAIQIATQWKNKNVLPILRRGLKDSDSQVVALSAAGIEKYRGLSLYMLSPKNQDKKPLPPRNVALTR